MEARASDGLWESALLYSEAGGVAERTNATVLKTVVRASADAQAYRGSRLRRARLGESLPLLRRSNVLRLCVEELERR